LNNDKLTVSYKDKVIDERYKIMETVGSGGMSVVLKAKDLVMNRYVALKILSEELDGNDKAVRRFANESKAVAMISCSNIVQIYDVNLDHSPKYIAMEYVSGMTLKDYLEKNAPLDNNTAVNLISQLLTALRHTHDKGIIHRDIKPQNVMLTEDLRIKLTDFGIAKLPDSELLEEDEKAMGTVHYISPEQASGKPVDFYTDIYSVGVIFYEMLTGRLPFEGDTPLSIAMMHVNNDPVSPRKYNEQIPTALEQIIMKSLSKNPKERFRTAASMNRVLKLYTRDNNIIFEKGTLDSIDETAVEPSNTEAKVKPKSDKVKYKHGKRTMFPIILGVTCAFFIVFMVAAVILAISLLDTTKDSSLTVVIPDLKGKIYDQTLVSALEDDNIRITEIEYVYDQNTANGTIISQKPDAGQRKKIESNNHFSEMTVKISRGNESVTVPDINITEYRNAILSLEAVGLKYKIVQSFSNSVLDGYVISTEPQAGTTVSKGDTVTVYVSLGQEVSYTTMPDLAGKTLPQIKQILSQYDLTLGKVFREPSELATGTVLSQSIPAGKSVPKKYTVVDITLSIKKPAPTVAPPTTLPIVTVPPTVPPTVAPQTSAVPPSTTLPVVLPSSTATTPPSSTVPPSTPSTPSTPPTPPTSSSTVASPQSSQQITVTKSSSTNNLQIPYSISAAENDQ